MALTMREKRAVTWELSKPYRKACKKEKGRLLDEMVRLTDYNRCYASYVLRKCRRTVMLKGKGKARVVFVGDHRKSIRRRKRKTYGSKVFSALKGIWEVCGYICGKRLAPYLKEIVGRVPFRVLGIDSDNGGEFINAHLKAFCEEKKITFTRSRPFRKNDNCFVEQKNYSVVRRAVGYWRYDTEEEREILNELYESLRLYRTFFQPVMKLREKQRIGSKVIKRYDEAKTPYRRVLECGVREGVSARVKRRLRREHARTNPAELNRKIGERQNQLIEMARGKRSRPGIACRPKEEELCAAG